MPTNQEILWAIRAQQWGRVKGELRTMTDMLGAVHGDYSGEEQPYQVFQRLAEAFIKQIEDDGVIE